MLKRLYYVLWAIITMFCIHNVAMAQQPKLSPDFSVSKSSITIASGVPSSHKSDTHQVKLEDKTHFPVHDFTFWNDSGFKGRISVTKGDNCSPLTTANKCTLTVTATNAVGKNKPKEQTTTLHIQGRSAGQTVERKLTVNVEQATVHPKGTYLTQSGSGSGSNRTITLENTGDVPLVITSAQLDSSSDHGQICDDSNDNCINTSSSSSTCLKDSNDNNDQATNPGETCDLKVKVSKQAYGSGQLELEGNMNDGDIKLPVNIAPTNIVFLEPGTGGADSGSCPAPTSSSNNPDAAPYATIPKSGEGVVCIGNYSQFPVHGRIKIRSGGDPGDFNFSIDTSGSGGSNSSECSTTFIPADTTCKINLWKTSNGRQGEEGEVVVAGKNMPQKRQSLAFGVEGGVLMLPINRQYLSQQFKGEQWPGLNFQEFEVKNTSSNDWKITEKPQLVSSSQADNKKVNSATVSTDHLKILESADSGHQGSTCNKDDIIPSQQTCQFWVKTAHDSGSNFFPPDIGFHADVQNVKMVLKSQKDSGDQFTFEAPVDLLTSLYAGGSFQSIDGIPNTGYLAKYGPKPNDYNTTGWSSVIPFANSTSINTLKVANNGNLYFGGGIKTLGNPPHPHQAFSPTAQTSPLGAGTNCTDSKPSGAEPKVACNVALYDGGQWHPLWQKGANGVDKTVNQLTINSDDQVYVGGDFETAGVQSDVGHIAMWQQRQGVPNWRILGVDGISSLAGVNGSVHALSFYTTSNALGNWPGWVAASTDKLLVGGQFDEAGNVDVDSSNAIWKPGSQSWSNNASGLTGFGSNDPQILSLIRFNSTNYAGGKFDLSSSMWGASDQHPFVKESSDTWEAPTDSGLKALSDKDNPFVNELYSFDGVKLAGDSSENKYIFVVGSFKKSIGGTDTTNILGYDIDNNQSKTLASSSTGANDTVNTVLARKLDDSNVFVFAGGDFTKINGSSIDQLGYWSDSDDSWHSLSDLTATPPRVQQSAKTSQPLQTDQVSGFQNGTVKALAIQTVMKIEPAQLTVS